MEKINKNIYEDLYIKHNELLKELMDNKYITESEYNKNLISKNSYNYYEVKIRKPLKWDDIKNSTFFMILVIAFCIFSMFFIAIMSVGATTKNKKEELGRNIYKSKYADYVGNVMKESYDKNELGIKYLRAEDSSYISNIYTVEYYF